MLLITWQRIRRRKFLPLNQNKKETILADGKDRFFLSEIVQCAQIVVLERFLREEPFIGKSFNVHIELLGFGIVDCRRKAIGFGFGIVAEREMALGSELAVLPDVLRCGIGDGVSPVGNLLGVVREGEEYLLFGIGLDVIEAGKIFGIYERRSVVGGEIAEIGYALARNLVGDHKIGQTVKIEIGCNKAVATVAMSYALVDFQ